MTLAPVYNKKLVDIVGFLFMHIYIVPLREKCSNAFDPSRDRVRVYVKEDQGAGKYISVF